MIVKEYGANVASSRHTSADAAEIGNKIISTKPTKNVPIFVIISSALTVKYLDIRVDAART